MMQHMRVAGVNTLQAREATERVSSNTWYTRTYMEGGAKGVARWTIVEP